MKNLKISHTVAVHVPSMMHLTAQFTWHSF